MKIILVDERIPAACSRSLEKAGFRVITLSPDRNLPDAISSHPDTLIFHTDGEIVTTADYCENAIYLFSDIRILCPHIKISLTDEKRGKEYPSDCIMNALALDGKLFCKEDTVSSGIKELAKRRGYSIVNVKQGYPRCTTLTFGKNAITADEGMACVLSAQGIKVTLIRNGDISLPPYEYGFIGGASFCHGNKVYFFGNPMLHRDGKLICDAIKLCGFEVVSLSDGPLIDLGGAIVL